MNKLIIVAYDLNPNLGSEAGNTYNLIKIISKEYDLLIYTNKKHQKDLAGSKLNIKYAHTYLGMFFSKLKLYNFSYRFFLNQIKNDLLSFNDKNTIIHFMTPHGIHSFNHFAHKLKIPYVIGPIGGFLPLPNGFKEYNNIMSSIKEFYYKRIIKNKKWIQYFINAKAIIAGTELVVNHLPSECKNKVSIILECIPDTDYFDGVRNRSIHEKKIQIAYSGRLETYKGCFILLKAFEKLISQGYKNIELIMAGDGKEYNSLKNMIKAKNLHQYVKLTGRLPRDKIRNILNNADIFCLPTLKEPGGTAILEAMSCGLPVITTNYGGPSYTVGKDCGILIDPVNVNSYVEELSKQLKILINNNELRRKLGQNARNHVLNNYSFSAFEQKILSFYNKVFK